MKNASHKVAAVIVAAGRGLRAGGEKPKQWQAVAGRRIVDWSVAAFAGHPAGFDIVLVLHPDDMGDAPAGMRAVAGGATRGASVRAGLEALAGDPPDLVLIHDAARPGVSAQVIDRVLAALNNADGAAPALAVTDALWRAEGAAITGAEPREGLYRAQTPQGFRYDAILNAHRADDGTAADDVAVALSAGLRVVHVEGDEDNLKVTTKQDFARIEQVLRARMTIRIGNGFDVHRFGPGDAVTLCGVSIPHERGLQGHSDADVGMHALTDAIYGALAEGDIGRHFPPSEAKWKGADSRIFLEHAVGLARARGLRLGNADVTLICEHPKIGPHATDMSAKLAEICAVGADQISVKATTSERLGFTGREEGIAAMATVALVAG